MAVNNRKQKKESSKEEETTQTVRVPLSLMTLVRARMDKNREKFQPYALRLIEADIRQADLSQNGGELPSSSFDKKPLDESGNSLLQPSNRVLELISDLAGQIGKLARDLSSGNARADQPQPAINTVAATAPGRAKAIRASAPGGSSHPGGTPSGVRNKETPPGGSGKTKVG